MPRKRPQMSGYARLAQAEEEEDSAGEDYEDESNHYTPRRTLSNSHYSPIQPGPAPRMTSPPTELPYHRRSSNRVRSRANSGVDIKAINARLERWADEIASKLKLRKIKGKTSEEEKLEIHYSVFQPPEGMRPATAESLAADMQDRPEERMTKMQFDDTVESVRAAIELGVHPKRISQGSSGSYFARNDDGKVVGVFKPKDEEPYASRNPKWTKWIHRNLFPFFFGRACLIPNLSYVSEAAAYVLDTRLQTNIVPYTDIVYFSSPAFYYDIWERRAYYRRRKPLPQKVGSLQVFLKGYQDATIFLKKHPWPEETHSYFPNRSSHKKSKSWADQCRPGSAAAASEEEEEGTETSERSELIESRRRKTFWTEALQLSFREELEKLVILDYLMRNTDRGLDNWMIRIDEASQQAHLVADPPQHQEVSKTSEPYPREDQMTMTGSTLTGDASKPKVMLGAIDNSLSWPWKHPDAWRSFPFGWLFLPVSLIGQPFTEKTRQHFLPLLTSKQWWSETQIALRRCFSQDADFKERMFARQMAVMKGQAWNVVETLKISDHGPLELTRRARVHVWDDLVDIPTVVPMRVPSADMRRREEARAAVAVQPELPEEMDISAVRSTDTNALINFDVPASGLPNPNKFVLSREGSNENLKAPESPMSTMSSVRSPNGDTPDRPPRPTRSKTRISFDAPQSSRARRKDRRRNFSFSAKNLGDYEIDDDGDLGYAAARDMEGNRKKVIVERLETVKGKNPVFTWC